MSILNAYLRLFQTDEEGNEIEDSVDFESLASVVLDGVEKGWSCDGIVYYLSDGVFSPIPEADGLAAYLFGFLTQVD